MLTSFFLFSLYVIVLAVITIVLLFTNLLGKWTVLILIAGWFPIIIWLVSILSLLVQHFGWRTFFSYPAISRDYLFRLSHIQNIRLLLLKP